ncbi:hypothetical protein C0J52_06985 [Blattella germanica]|nr:hypothetical protein C0J52_06985 [Blattella germanica]
MTLLTIFLFQYTYVHRVPLATEPDMNCNNFNNFNTNGDIAVKFEVNLFYATME